MNRDDFYATLRKRSTAAFGTRLSQQQVDAMEALLDQGGYLPLSWLAYAMATARGEVGPSMQPVREKTYYSSAATVEKVFGPHRRQGIPASRLARNPELLANTVYGGEWGEKNLGNTEPGDGYFFRGGGWPQTTGRRNYQLIKDRTGIDVVSNPDLILDPAIASAALFAAMEDGIYTGKSFADYLPKDGPATRAQFVEARRIINGQDKAQTFAGYAEAFQKALIAARYKPSAARGAAPKPTKPKPVPIFDTPVPDPARPTANETFSAALRKSVKIEEDPKPTLADLVARFFKAIFGGRK